MRRRVSRARLSLLKHKKSMTLRHAAEFKGVGEMGGETDIESQLLDNREHFIYGCSPWQYQSCQNALTLLESVKVQAVLLGNTSLQNYSEHSSQRDYYAAPVIYDRLEHIQAKDKMTRFFTQTFPKHTSIFKHSPSNMVYHADTRHRMQYFDEDLSLAYQVCGMPKVKLLFAKPDYFLHLEDLALTLSLDTLRDMFHQVLEACRQQAQGSPVTAIQSKLVLDKVRAMAESLYSARLAQKTGVYQASLLRASNESLGATLLTTSRHLVGTVKDIMHLRNLPQIDGIFRTYLTPAQKDSLSAKRAFVKPKLRIALQNAAKLHPDYDYAQIDREVYEGLCQMDPDEIIEKYVILNILVSNEFRGYLQHGQNPFESSIYQQIVGGKYKTVSEVGAKFEEINARYGLSLHRQQDMGIIGLKQRRSTTRDDFRPLSAQRQDIKETHNYRFSIHHLNRLKDNVLLAATLKSKVEEYVAQEVRSNQMDTGDLEQIQLYKQGVLTVSNIKVMMAYFVRANDELGGVLTFPKVFKAALPQLAQYKYKELEDLQHDLEAKSRQITREREASKALLSREMGGKNVTELEIELPRQGKETRYLSDLAEKEDALRQKVYGVIMGGEKAGDYIEELQKMSMEEIEGSDNLVASIRIRQYADGSVKPEGMGESQGAQIDALMKEMDGTEDDKLQALLRQVKEENV